MYGPDEAGAEPYWAPVSRFCGTGPEPGMASRYRKSEYGGHRRRPVRRADRGPGQDPAGPDAEGERGHPDHRLPPLRRLRHDGRAVQQHRLPQGRHLRGRPDLAPDGAWWPDRRWRHRHEHAAAEHPGLGRKYDPFNRLPGKPQLDKAKQALAACGQPNGFSTKIAVRNNKPAEVKTAEALQAALKAAGINATIDQYDGSQLSSIVGAPNIVKQRGYGIMIAGWGADYPTLAAALTH